MRLLTFGLSLTLFLAGCPTRDQIEHRTDGGGERSPSDAGGGRKDADADRAQDEPPEPNSVSITNPSATTYTNGTVNITVATTRPVTLPIAIYADATEVGTVVPPSTGFSWNTTGVPEKTYSVTAQTVWNGQTLTSSPVMVIVDRTAPTITKMTPAPGATNVIMASPISVSVSEPLLPRTVTPGFVSVTAGGISVPTTLSLDPTGQVVTVAITSTAGLALPQTFTAALTTAPVTDLAGNSLAVSSSSWTWAVPDWIQLPPFATYSAPVLAISPDFHPAIVYTQSTSCGQNGCATALHVAEDDGQGWNDLGQPGMAAGAGSLAFDSKSRAVVSWGGFDGSSPAAFVGTWSGTAWDLSLPPIDEIGDGVGATVLRLDSMDRPFVALRLDAGANSDVFVAHWTGTAWDTSFGSVGASTARNVDLLLTPQGVPLVGVQDSSGSAGLYQWTGTAWMPSPDAGAAAASLAFDANGNAAMISNWRIEHLTNGSWLPLTSALVPSSTAATPRIANTPTRSFALAWWDDSPPPAGIGLARWTGSSWDSRPGVARVSDSAAGIAPSLVVDARGAMWIAWFAGTTSNVWMSNY